jgi:ABC-type Na+ efflux pump permease subunit
VGSTWKWAILAAVIGVGTMCSAHPVGLLVDARAYLARSYSVVPQPGSASVDPNEPWPVDYSQMTQTSAPNGEVVVSYIAMLALSSAVMVALACLLLLALAGIVTKSQKSPDQSVVSSGSFPHRRRAWAAKKLPA